MAEKPTKNIFFQGTCKPVKRWNVCIENQGNYVEEWCKFKFSIIVVIVIVVNYRNRVYIIIDLSSYIKI